MGYANQGYYVGNVGARSLGRNNVNSVWQVFGTNTIIRWAYSQTNRQNVCMSGLFQRMSVGQDWDLFHSMRDSRGWDNDQDATAGSHWSTQFAVNGTNGATYQV